MSEKKDTRGGAREGSGRKRTAPDGEVRKMRSLRASEEEWEIIKSIAKRLKEEPERIKKLLQTTE